MRLVKKETLLSIIDGALISYPVPSNISYWWGYGSLAGIVLVLQIITGILLAMHYTPHVDYAFLSVEHIMRDVNYGWFLRYMHANGASMFFVVVYTHIARGLYYGSYMKPRERGWGVGVIIFLLMMGTAFMGYILPWGQMSYWGATVITNLFGALPVVGKPIVTWLWGGFSVDNPTLNRFFSLHYLLPFVLVAAVVLHITFLHEDGANNPLGVNSKTDQISFYPYFHVKDLFGLVIFALIFSYFIFYNPNVLGHSDNYIPANPMVTPPHIVPEWYFLPFYAILRSIPDKLGGVLAMFASIGILLLLPHITNPPTRGSSFRPIYKMSFWFILGDTSLLGWIGCQPVEDPYILIGQIATVFYFMYFLIFLPILGFVEKHLVDSMK
jgi:quinol-cytochrome oxidoreductase complex cytochrome b subunit